MKIINLFLFFSFCIGFSNPVKHNINTLKTAPECKVTVTITNLSCSSNTGASNDGAIKVIASETTDIKIIWSSNTSSTLIPNQWEQNSLMAGYYTIEVIHKGTSVYKQTHQIMAPNPLKADIKKSDNKRCGAEEGSINITANGGTPPYLHSINGGLKYQSDPFFDRLANGTYQVVVKDLNNCTFTKKIEIFQGHYYSIHHPEPGIVEECSSQEEIDKAFEEWLKGFKFYGGVKPHKETLSYGSIPGPCGGSVTVTYTVVDDCGVEKSCETTFTVVKKGEINIVTEAESLVVSCDQDSETAFQQWLANNGNAVANSSCDVVWTNNYSPELWDGSCESSKTIEITFTASNGCETKETKATFSIQDKQAPSFVETLPTDVVVSCGMIPEAEVLTAIDNCDEDVLVEFIEDQTTDGCSTSLERTWTATDCSGNTVSHTQIINIEDKQAPSFVETLPTDVVVSCGMIPEAEVLTAIDNCDEDVLVEFVEDQTTDGCSTSLERTWTATDCSGNTVSHTQIISIEDKQPPSFVETLPTDVVVSCGMIPEAEMLTAIDDCDQDVLVQFKENLSTDGCSSSLERTWTATDCSGNTLSHTQTISIEDKQAPSFVETLPTDVVVSCGMIPEAKVLTAIDNCDEDVLVEFKEDLTTDGCTSSLERTWTATDCSGNTVRHTQTISIEDKQPPSFVETLPTDVVVSCGMIPQAEVLTAIDNCDEDVLVEFKEDLTKDGCSSSLERTWTSTDCSGNTVSHTQIISIEDKLPPILSSASEEYQQNIIVECGEIPATPVLEFEDNCSQDLNIIFSENSSDISSDGSYQITRLWQVSDQCDNTTEFTQIINVSPNSELKFNIEPGDLSVDCGKIPEPETLTATDGCANSVPVNFTETLLQTKCSPIIERQWTATDSNGNQISHIQIINVEDKQPPVFEGELPQDLTLNCSTLPEVIILSAVDQCDQNVVVELQEFTSTEDCTQITTRIWTAVDCAGNATSHTQVIKLIQDTESPQLTASSLEIFQEQISTNCANIPETPQLEFQDQCSSELDIVFEETSSYVDDQTDYEIQRIWQVTDPCENQAIFTQTISVSQDNSEQEVAEIMLCQRDAIFDLNSLLSSGGNLTGQWTLSSEDTALSGSFFDPSMADLGVYTAYYTPEDSCTAQNVITITVHDDCVVLPCDSSQSVAISKAITPNGDAYNEYFTVSGLEACGFKLELQIFNRWGAKIYQSMDYQNNWNAFSNTGNSRFMPAGTYYYILTVVDSGYDPIKGYVYVGTTAK